MEENFIQLDDMQIDKKLNITLNKKNINIRNWTYRKYKLKIILISYKIE